MKMIPVKSTNIQSIGWDSKKKRMYVLFLNGSKYRIQCPIHIYREMRCASSKGSFYATVIRNQFPVEKCEAPVIVATPCYLTLLQTRKMQRSNPNRPVRMCLWMVCGKKEPGVYKECYDLIEQSRGKGDAILRAIAKAKKRKI